jgi:hypothetical protein
MKDLCFVYTEEQRRAFKAGIWQQWIKDYPDYFTIEEGWSRIQMEAGYGFFEMLTAVSLIQATGYRLLGWGNRNPKNTPKKTFDILQRLLPDELFHLAFYGKVFEGHSPQPPDLFLYHPDFSNFFFCEVKGGTDRLSKQQKAYFEEIDRLSDGRVYLCKWRRIGQK